jgi:hypothetical protein
VYSENRCVGAPKSVPGRWLAAPMSEVPSNLSQYKMNTIFFLWRYSPNLGLGLPPWNSPFHFGLLHPSHSVGFLGRVISSSQRPCLYTNTEKCTRARTHTHTHTHEHQTSMPWVRFESTIPASERATVTDQYIITKAVFKDLTIDYTVACFHCHLTEGTQLHYSLAWRNRKATFHFLE